MMDNLYSSPSLCVRELLQNSLDALRYRKALYKVNDIESDDGKICLEHFVNEQGYEVLKCTDNGIGMDELVIKEYLTKVGRSYYRPPYFEQEKVRLQHAGADFDPCSQFGIGFISCFMIGDRILIETRRDYGYGRELGKPLIVEVNGLGGLVVIRQGKPEQAAGTTVLIFSRNKLSFVDEWWDKIKLIAVTRYMKYIAHKYFEIDWAKYRCELKPPYQIWLKNKGLIEIDESDFENWRRSK